MIDKLTDSRAEFDKWLTSEKPAILLSVDLPMLSGDCVKKQPFYTQHQLNFAWQAATESATLRERERCAQIADSFDENADYGAGDSIRKGSA